MIIWIDAQLSPAIATWVAENFAVSAQAVRDLGLREATDRTIFLAAKAASAVVMTKDSDFVRLLEELGHPPQRNLAHLRQHVECCAETHFDERFAAVHHAFTIRRAVG